MNTSEVQDHWNDYRTRLLRFVRSRVHDDVLAEDIVHDSILKAWQKRDTLKDGDAVVPWLFQITMNTLRDAYKSRSSIAMGEDAEEVPAVEDRPSVNNAGSDHRDFAGCLSRMIESLEPDNRSTLIRSEIDGVPMRVIAEELGLSISAVKSRVQRSRTQLRHAMLACCKIELNQRGEITSSDDHDCTC